MLNRIQPDITTNKFKKYSSVYNHSSIQFNKSEKKLDEVNAKELPNRIEKQDISRQKSKDFENRQDSLPILKENDKESRHNEYESELTTIYLLQARMYVKIKNYDQAISFYKKCLKYNPRKVEAIL